LLIKDFEKMIVWLVLKLERLVIELEYLGRFWFLLEDFLKIVFLHGKIFECFHNSCFASRYFLMEIARPQCDTPPFPCFQSL
jgi:hypothetical protein